LQRIISADSHISITDEKFFGHLPEKYHEMAHQALNENAARSAAKWGKSREHDWPSRNRSGAWDPHQRIKDMDTDKVDAEVMYGQDKLGWDLSAFYALKDTEARIACFRAYNDALGEWIAVSRDRLIPVAVFPVQSVEDGVHELNRLAKKGFKAAIVPTYPDLLGLPPYWDRQYDPIWATAQDVGIPISLHTNTSKGLDYVLESDPLPSKAITKSLPPITMSQLVAQWILAGPLPRFPKLHMVLVEAGIGWIGYYLTRLDTMFHRHAWKERSVVSELPSTYWRRQGHATFEDDPVGIATRQWTGVETLMWATDYPHPDSTWPDSAKVLEQHFKGVPEAEKRMIVHDNAARLYQLN